MIHPPDCDASTFRERATVRFLQLAVGPMKQTLTLTSLAALLMFGAPLAQASVATPARTPVAAQSDQATWRAAFNKAMAVGATSEMEKLVKKNTFQATEWIIDTAQGIAIQPSEVLETRMAALRNAWKSGIGSKFADNMYEYFSLLDPVYRDERNKLKRRYDKAYTRYEGNLTKKDHTTFGVIAAEFEGLAGAFAELGDFYFSSQGWLMVYLCTNEAARGDKADLYKACEALKNMTAERKKVDLQDRQYLEASTAYKSLAAQGYDRAAEEGESGGDAGPAPGPSKEGAATQAVLTFEMITKMDAFDRPSFYADELHNLWTRIAFQKKGSSTKFSSLGDLSPKVQRTGSAEVLVDTDGDGTGDLSVPLRGNLDPIEFEIGQGAEKRKWGVLTKIGTQSDMYQNIQVAMQPTDDQMLIYLAPGASMVGEIAGTPIRIIDENMDGVYGSPPLTWGHEGLTKGQMQPEFDSILIGKEKRARPWSEYQQIGDKWYRLEVQNGGTSISATEIELPTGSVKVNFKGTKPSWLVVQGTGRYENSYFDLMEKGVELPVGGYKLFCGELRKGKKQQTMKALMLPGKEMEVWRVQEGKPIEVTLGGPFKFDFKFDEDEDSITVDGRSVVIMGVGGERYERPWNCVPRPEASYRKPGAKKGSKPEKLGAVMSQDEINQAGDWAVAWFPIDVTLKKKGRIEKSEVALEEKKNKLFGKIPAAWKE